MTVIKSASHRAVARITKSTVLSLAVLLARAICISNYKVRAVSTCGLPVETTTWSRSFHHSTLHHANQFERVTYESEGALHFHFTLLLLITDRRASTSFSVDREYSVLLYRYAFIGDRISFSCSDSAVEERSRGRFLCRWCPRRTYKEANVNHNSICWLSV